MNRKSALIVCAHPDDEVLGCGGYIQILKEENYYITVIFFTDGYYRKYSKEFINKKRKFAKKSCKKLKVDNLVFFGEKALKLDIRDKTLLNNKLTSYIKKLKPEIVLTHHWSDINKDHNIVFDCVTVATRPINNQNIKKLICFETLSSTEWNLKSKLFNPNFYVKINKNHLEKKIDSFLEYETEVFESPHPRSKEGIINLAKFRGQNINELYAEGFQIVREIK